MVVSLTLCELEITKNILLTGVQNAEISTHGSVKQDGHRLEQKGCGIGGLTMTDNEALEILDRCADTAYNCGSVTVSKDDMREIYSAVFRLKLENNHLQNDVAALETLLEQAKVVAIKKVFDKLEERLAVQSFKTKSEDYTDGQIDCMEWVDSRIDELKKELCGESDG